MLSDEEDEEVVRRYLNRLQVDAVEAVAERNADPTLTDTSNTVTAVDGAASAMGGPSACQEPVSTSASRDDSPASLFGGPEVCSSSEVGAFTRGDWAFGGSAAAGNFLSDTAEEPKPASEVGAFADERERLTLDAVTSRDAIVADIYTDGGRLLLRENLINPDLTFYFNRQTLLDGSYLSPSTGFDLRLSSGMPVVCYVNSADLQSSASSGTVRVCGMVLVEKQSGFNSDAPCWFTVRGSERAAEGPAVRVVGVVLSQKPASAAIAAAACGQNGERVCVPAAALPRRRLLQPLLDAAATHFGRYDSTVADDNDEMVEGGRSVSMQVVDVPAWAQTQLGAFEWMAVCVEAYGDVCEGLGVVVQHLSTGDACVMRSQWDDGLGDMYLPKKTALNGGSAATASLPPVDAEFFFRACKEVPGRAYQWRVFRLIQVDVEEAPSDAIPGDPMSSARSDEQNLMDAVDVPQGLTDVALTPVKLHQA